MRTTISLLLGALFVSGCLFPSFDDMQGGRNGGIAAKSEPNATDSNETVPSSQPPQSTATDAGSTDAATTTTPTSNAPRAIACDGDAGVCPADGRSFCCATMGGPSCQGPGTEGFCTSVEGGKILRCDDRADCPTGNVCCFLGGAKEAACMPSCAGALLCSKDDPTCPAGKSCTGVITHGGGFQSSFCQ